MTHYEYMKLKMLFTVSTCEKKYQLLYEYDIYMKIRFGNLNIYCHL